MATTDTSSQVNVEFGTAHYSERLEPASAGAPAQMCWRDVHPPGLRVLPRGSAPAGAGEINWEDTLGGKLAHAIKQLDGLMTTVGGSRPAAYPATGGGYDKCDWPDRVHPRCLWGVEFWKPTIIVGPTGCNVTGTCWDYEVFEYAALGSALYGSPVPTVPKRSRSGDPEYQYRRGLHDREVFPLGSVARDDGAELHDPEGKGWFGARNPGRDDAATNPWLKTANGYTYKAGQTITLQWTKPSGAEDPSSVALFYRVKPPGGTWGAWASKNMVPISGVWYESLGPYQHGTEVRWYLRHTRFDPLRRVYEPGDTAAPADEDAYYLQWYTHYNPYGNGLPELLDDYGSWGDIRHGTDFFEFDGSETIQVGLIAFLRQVISMLVGRTCYNRYEHCSEGAGHPGAMHHNPRLRETSWGHCCISWPIMFYWSGSAPYPHYQRGGKGDTEPSWDPLDTRPLLNMDTEVNVGSQVARMTWRGVEPVFGDSPWTNPKFGRGASWQVQPFEHRLYYAPALATEAEVHAKYEHANLRAGDVIDAVHIQEIIDAVAYLIDNGVWTTYEIHTCKKTIDSFVGKQPGYWLVEEDEKSAYYYEETHERREAHHPCVNCCADTSYCEPAFVDNYYYLLEHTQWHYEWEDEQWVKKTWSAPTGWYNDYDLHCDPIQEPSWSNCWNQTGDCIAGKCNALACKTHYCQNMTHDLHAAFEGTYSFVTAPGEAGVITYYCHYPPTGGAYYKCQRMCYFWSEDCQEYYPCTAQSCVIDGLYTEIDRCTAFKSQSTTGVSFYACTGPAIKAGGWDDDHGGGWVKKRFDHTWAPGLSSVATGPPGNELSGCGFGDIYVCGTLATGEHPNLWFEEVRGVDWDGIGDSWYDASCDCTAEVDGGCPRGAPVYPPGLPGFGLHDAEGDPLCVEHWHEYYGYDQAEDYVECEFGADQFEPCQGQAAWAAAALNLDGTGRPYRNYAGIDDDQEPYDGPGVPTVTPYDLTKDPETWMHGCPCETWTGGEECE